jgi:hypothetical protein
MMGEGGVGDSNEHQHKGRRSFYLVMFCWQAMVVMMVA